MGFWKSGLSMISAMAITSSSFAQNVAAPGAPAKVDRPPQYVMLAFDGSLNLAFWEESRQFVKDAAKAGAPLKFTYFLSGPYFLHSGNKSIYDTPRLGRGHSAIGWSSSLADIGPRLDEVNNAYKEGNEMGSHANGHFDGGGTDSGDPMYKKTWTQADWEYEFAQFNDLIFGAYKNNGLKPSAQFPNGLIFKQDVIKGFRAPKLGVSEGLWPALAKYKFTYDTSKTAGTVYWPQKNSFGTWNFPLAELPLVGTAKKTLSMDFNFYVSQTKGLNVTNANPAMKAVLQKQMVDSYMNYFNENYYGRRAPINIGHHFSKWNGGAYWDAMKQFALQVCKMKEVKCVTYTEYQKFLESVPAQTMAAYRAGAFDRMAPTDRKPVAGPVIADVDLVIGQDVIAAVSKTPGQDKVRGFVTKLSLNGQVLEDKALLRSQIEKLIQTKELVTIGAHTFNKDGLEIISKTHEIRDFDSPSESVSAEPLEARALKGDLPEAHDEE